MAVCTPGQEISILVSDSDLFIDFSKGSWVIWGFGSSSIFRIASHDMIMLAVKVVQGKVMRKTARLPFTHTYIESECPLTHKSDSAFPAIDWISYACVWPVPCHNFLFSLSWR